MIIKELFEGPVGDYCIARNTIKCLFKCMVTLSSIKYRIFHPKSSHNSYAVSWQLRWQAEIESMKII